MPYAYGSSATRVTAPQAAANRQIYGVDTPAQLVARYHLGGVILLPRNTLQTTLADLPTNNSTDPTAVPGLVNGLQAPLCCRSAQEFGTGLDHCP